VTPGIQRRKRMPHAIAQAREEFSLENEEILRELEKAE
jgi:hypothetical protein